MVSKIFTRAEDMKSVLIIGLCLLNIVVRSDIAGCNVDDITLPNFPPPPLNASHPTVNFMSMLEKAGAKAVKAGDGHATCYEWKCQSKSGTCRFCTPSLYIAGFSKCGTSALFNKLLGHPQIRKYWTKEVEIFNKRLADTQYGTSLSALEQLLKNDENDINAHFLDGSAGTARDLQSITLLKHFSPATKVIFVVRDFHGRFQSWLTQTAYFRGKKKKDDIVLRGERLIRTFYQNHIRNNIDMSLSVDYLQNYVFQGGLMGYFLMGQILIPWKQAFGDNLLVVDHANILRRPRVVLRQIEEFAQLKKHSYDKDILASVANVHGNYGWNSQGNTSATAVSQPRQPLRFSRMRQVIIDRLFANSACVMKKLIGWAPKNEYIYPQ